MDGQWNYYSRAALRRQSMGTWLNRVAMGFFVLGLLLAGAKPLFHGNVAFNVAIGLAPAVAALLYMYAHTRAFLEQARQYDRMSQLFGNCQAPPAPGPRGRRSWKHFSTCSWISARRPCARMAIGSCLHRERPITFGAARSWVLAGSWILGVCSRRRRKPKPLHPK